MSRQNVEHKELAALAEMSFDDSQCLSGSQTFLFVTKTIYII